MKKRGDSAYNMIIVLALICAAAGLALGATYRATRGRIEAQQLRERMAALRIVLPEAHKDGFREMSTPKSAFAAEGRYYEAYDKALGDASGELVGYALEAEGDGYSSKIRITVGVDPKGEVIRGIKITFQQETPGLGANCEAIEAEGTLWDAIAEGTLWNAFLRKGKEKTSEPRFQAQFRGKMFDSFVKVGNQYRNIDGLTGATITTNAVADAAVGAVEEFKKRILKSSDDT